jgi:hypothetical protein
MRRRKILSGFFLAWAVMYTTIFVASSACRPPPDGCTARATRCTSAVVNGATVHAAETCTPSPSSYWMRGNTCEPGAVCCVLRGETGRLISGCTDNPLLCVATSSDAATTGDATDGN